MVSTVHSALAFHWLQTTRSPNLISPHLHHLAVGAAAETVVAEAAETAVAEAAETAVAEAAESLQVLSQAGSLR